MGIGDILGVIFAALLILIAIALAVWFFGFRRAETAPSGARTCTKDTDCVAGPPLPPLSFPPQGTWEGELCLKGTCQNVPCARNQECGARGAHGATCFGAGPNVKGSAAGCIPLTCRTTNDCNPAITAATSRELQARLESAPAICSTNQAGGGFCVPAKPNDGQGCYPGLTQNSAGKCVVCDSDVGGATSCLAGSFCANGRCLRCGDQPDNKCNGREDPAALASLFSVCEIISGTATCDSGTCTKTTSQGTITTLPDGTALQSTEGICLPESPQCAFSWFNTAGSVGGTAPSGGQCPQEQPFCNSSAQCTNTPEGAVCGFIPGVPANGLAGNGYDLTGICGGRVVPRTTVANIAQFNTAGEPATAFRCSIRGVSKNDCSCNPQNSGPDGSNPECAKGSICNPTSVQTTVNGTTQATKGLCTVVGSTGTQLGRFYPGTCSIDTSGLAVCVNTAPTEATPPPPNTGNPGEFCYVDGDCLLYGIPQPKSAFKALKCSTSNNVCIGSSGI